MVKQIQELEQVAKRLMQQAYQRGRAKSSGSFHRGCVSTLLGLVLKFSTRVEDFFFDENKSGR